MISGNDYKERCARIRFGKYATLQQIYLLLIKSYEKRLSLLSTPFLYFFQKFVSATTLEKKILFLQNQLRILMSKGKSGFICLFYENNLHQKWVHPYIQILLKTVTCFQREEIIVGEKSFFRNCGKYKRCNWLFQKNYGSSY